MKVEILEPKALQFVKNHKVFFTTAIELGGFVGSAILLCRETTKAEKIIKEMEEENEVTTNEKVKIYCFTMWPGILLASGTCGLITYANVNMGNTIKNLGALALLSKTSLDDYKQAALNKVGDKKEKQISDEAIRIHEKRNEFNYTDSDVIDLGNGPTLFKEPITGMLFRSNIQFVKSKAVEFADYTNGKNGSRLSDYLDLLGLPIGEAANKYVFMVDTYGLPKLNLVCSQWGKDGTGEAYNIVAWDNPPKICDDDMWLDD